MTHQQLIRRNGCLLIAALMGFQPGVTVQQRLPVAVVIGTPTPVVKGGAPVRVNITLRNSSDHTVRIQKPLGADGQAECANRVVVSDSKKQELPLRKTEMCLSAQFLPLEPAQSIRDYVVLSDLFDLKRPGTYTVQVFLGYWLPDGMYTAGGKKTQIPSNTITITVKK